MEIQTAPAEPLALQPEPMAPHMTPDERGLFNRYARRSISVIEFGSGGSTLEYFRRPQIERVITVESDPLWLAKLGEQPVLKEAKEAGRWVPVQVDIGATKDWGWPADYEASRARFPNYHAPVWHDHPGLYDLVLVDGRFRVACALQALPFIKPRGVLIIHDFFSRPKYLPVLKFFDVVARADDMVVLKPKAELRMRQYVTALNRFYFDPA